MKNSPLLIAVDIGNARIKLGRFANDTATSPEPDDSIALLGDQPDFAGVAAWLEAAGPRAVSWCIASVNRPAATRLINWIRDQRPADRVTLLACGDLPLQVGAPRPDMVGIDRLVDAVAANVLREPHRAAVIVDVGTAITVDLISEAGEFLGGAILPGIQMAGHALHDYTDMLPLVDAADLTTPPPPLGTATLAAIQAGLFWGAVGSVRELVAQFRATVCQSTPMVFLTGGAGAQVAQLLGDDAQYVPNLTLSGVAIAARWHIADSNSQAPD